MLRENVWVERKLFNGSMGIVRDIGWPVGAGWEKEPLYVLLIDFDDYNGPSYCDDLETGRLLVPIFRFKREWTRGAVHCTRI
jgi:hypothetical protein